MVVKVQVTDPNKANPRKIPSAIFIERVAEFIKEHQVENIMESLNEVYNKYKVMEMQIQKQKDAMQSKVPEIERALEALELFRKGKDSDYLLDYHLVEQIWAKARVSKNVNHVNLWLGANTMVQFTIDEAYALLQKNLLNAKSNLESFMEDLVFLKDQITTTEINISRTYNTNLQLVKEAKEQLNK